MSIVRFNPWWEIDRSLNPGGWVPVADVWETPSAYRIDLELPAVAAEDVDVSVNEGVLEISGERRPRERGEDERSHRVERRYGRFSRRFRLPENADEDAIRARVANGVLEVTIDKRAEHRPRRIEVIAA